MNAFCDMNFRCPECGIVMEKLHSDGKVMRCFMKSCKLYGKLFKVPSFELEAVSIEENEELSDEEKRYLIGEHRKHDQNHLGIPRTFPTYSRYNQEFYDRNNPGVFKCPTESQ